MLKRQLPITATFIDASDVKMGPIVDRKPFKRIAQYGKCFIVTTHQNVRITKRVNDAFVIWFRFDKRLENGKRLLRFAQQNQPLGLL